MMHMPFTIHAAVLSDTGRIRHHNEDAFYCNGFFNPLEDMDRHTEHDEHITDNRCLFAICDGMGGQQHGEQAANAAIGQLGMLRQQLPGRDFRTVMQHWLQQTNRVVREFSDGGGCTLALLYVESTTVRFCHVGDSRIYRFHQAQLTCLTRDHSQVALMVSAGMITPEEARTHPHRHAITRYLGMPAPVTCEASYGEDIPFIADDIYLLCSDGVTDMLTDEALAHILRTESSLTDMAKRIYQEALDAGGRDNITLQLVQLQHCSEEPLPMAPDEEDEPTIDCGPPEPLDQTITLRITQTNGAAPATTTDVTMSLPVRPNSTVNITTIIGKN